MKLKKLIQRLILLIFVVIISIGGYFTYLGYTMYKEAIEKTPIEEMVKSIQSIEHYTTLDELPEMYLDAVVAVEDQRFYSHPGIDIFAISRALWHDLQAMSFVEGGSTITQQLAKNVYFTQEKRIERKIAEVFMAFEIEKQYSKDEILELYLNSIYFGDGYYCVYDASMGYFNKAPFYMNDYESTMLAGIPNAPSAYSPTVSSTLASQRQRQVLKRMVETKVITQEKANEILAQKSS